MIPFRKKKQKKKTKEVTPHSITQSIPYKSVYKDGIIEVAEGVFSKSYLWPDINFVTVDDEDQQKLSSEYAAFIGTFEEPLSVQLTLFNKTIAEEAFKETTLVNYRDDALDTYREEYNEMLTKKMLGAKNNLQTIRILTVTAEVEDIRVAKEQFAQIDSSVIEQVSKITKYEPSVLTIRDRLEILNQIYNPKNTTPLYQTKMVNGELVESYNLDHLNKQGITTKDLIAPPVLNFNSKGVQMEGTVAKTYFIANYPTWIKGSLLVDLASMSTNLLVSAYFKTIPHAEAAKLLKNRNIDIADNLIELQKKASKGGYDPSLISPDLQHAKNEVMELTDDLTNDVRLFTTNIVITLFADDYEGLAKFEHQLKMVASRHLIAVSPLGIEMERGFNASLPLGHSKLAIERLMTTYTLSSIIPFNVKDVIQPKGIYYGLNASSKNMILYNRATDINPCGCILGMPGSGKSFAAKKEMISVLLNTDDQVYVVDPEGEYVALAEAFGGSVIKIAKGMNNYINPFDLNIENGGTGGDAVKIKSGFIQTICEIASGKYGLTSSHQSIIDRCVTKIYRPYLEYLEATGKSIDLEHAPTMQDFWDELNEQPEMDARTLAITLEQYVIGGMDIFSKKTNVDITNRFTVYDIRDIGRESALKEMGLQICLDNIWNKMIENRGKGTRTWFYIDEFYILMQKPTSASYISEIWKRARKWGGVPTAITQNVEDMLKSEEARAIINTSNFVMLFKQSAVNKAQLSTMLGISAIEQDYISSTKPGMGLLRIGESQIPMDDSFPTDSRLYKAMSTKLEED